MQLGTFVFPTSADPADDGRIIGEAMDEAVLSEHSAWMRSGLPSIISTACAPMSIPSSFAAALAQATTRVRIGFAVVQASLHHPLRLAEQISLLDHLTEGRLIAGLGKGSMYNAYEYEAFEIEPAEAAARFDCCARGPSRSRIRPCFAPSAARPRRSSMPRPAARSSSPDRPKSSPSASISPVARWRSTAIRRRHRPRAASYCQARLSTAFSKVAPGGTRPQPRVQL